MSTELSLTAHDSVASMLHSSFHFCTGYPHGSTRPSSNYIDSSPPRVICHQTISSLDLTFYDHKYTLYWWTTTLSVDRLRTP